MKDHIIHCVLWQLNHLSEVLDKKGFKNASKKVDFCIYMLWYPISKLQK